MILDYAIKCPSDGECCMASILSCSTFCQEIKNAVDCSEFSAGILFFFSVQLRKKYDNLILKGCFPPLLSHFSKNSKEFKLYNISVLHASCVLCLSDASSDFQTAGLSQPYFTPIIFLHDLQSYFK